MAHHTVRGRLASLWAGYQDADLLTWREGLVLTVVALTVAVLLASAPN